MSTANRLFKSVSGSVSELAILRPLIGCIKAEHQQYSLWFFISFIAATAIYFSCQFTVNLSLCAASIALIALLIHLLPAKHAPVKYMLSFVLAFTLGLEASEFRMHLTNTVILKEKYTGHLHGKIKSIIPANDGVHILLTDITIGSEKHAGDGEKRAGDGKKHTGLQARLKVKNKLLRELESRTSRFLNDGQEGSTYLPTTLPISEGQIVSIEASLFPLNTAILPGSYDFGFYQYMQGIGASGFVKKIAPIDLFLGKNNSGKNNSGKNSPSENSSRENNSPNNSPNNSDITASSNDTIISTTIISAITQKTDLVRRYIYDRIISSLGADEGNFVSAVLIGITSGISPQISNTMRASGVSHILSVSGLHLSLVAMIFFFSSRFLLNLSNYASCYLNIKGIAAVIALLASLMYLFLTGAKIAATRAFIMTSIFIISHMIGRSPYPLRSIFFAAFIILLLSPEYVLHPSFQLSFAAVLSLVSGYEFYLRNEHRFGKRGGIFASVKFYFLANIYTSIVASIATAPFVLFHFFKFANYAVPMNLIAVPLMSFVIMPLGCLALLFSGSGLDVAIYKLIGHFVGIITSAADSIVSLPGSIWHLGHISISSLGLYSFGFIWFCTFKTQLRFIGLCLMLIAFGIMLLRPLPTFLYDTKSEALLIHQNRGGYILYQKHMLPHFTKEYMINWLGLSTTASESNSSNKSNSSNNNKGNINKGNDSRKNDSGNDNANDSGNDRGSDRNDNKSASPNYQQINITAHPESGYIIGDDMRLLIDTPKNQLIIVSQTNKENRSNGYKMNREKTQRNENITVHPYRRSGDTQVIVGYCQSQICHIESAKKSRIDRYWTSK